MWYHYLMQSWIKCAMSYPNFTFEVLQLLFSALQGLRTVYVPISYEISTCFSKRNYYCKYDTPPVFPRCATSNAFSNYDFAWKLSHRTCICRASRRYVAFRAASKWFCSRNFEDTYDKGEVSNPRVRRSCVLADWFSSRVSYRTCHTQTCCLYRVVCTCEPPNISGWWTSCRTTRIWCSYLCRSLCRVSTGGCPSCLCRSKA